ncbi:MAG TPA: 6,7-dimethyl-8-ribityllumazine synthase [Thermodesulfobacteriota bacterium]|nr:6,7-dimethyl-8-ribityllumazine synthase [Thermodesulfobacteriota bacterium]
MPNVFEGNLSAKGLKIAIVASRFNDFIGERLLEGAMDTLLRSGMDGKDIDVFKVPGTFEMPLVVTTLARKKSHDAIICVGAVIRGSTPHFDFVAGEAAKGIAKASVESGVPIAFGVITADTIEQAIERAGTKSGNKGRDAALTAIEMANLLRSMKKS